jgi:homogentisate phytyltransferase / homogentisate geranylgeranyltransferase
MTIVGALFARTMVPWPSAIVALVAALLMNVYIVGLNQLCDIEIDRVNKPDLPLAAGDLGVAAAWRIIMLALLTSLALGFIPVATPALRAVLFGSAALGTAYSVPPIRLKRHAFLASVAILSVRGLLVNSCFFLHAIGAQKLFPLALPPLVSAICILFVVFGIIIALLKDVPDIRGDKIFNIRTFSVRIGATAVFRVVQVLLFLLYAGGAAISLWLAPSRLFGSISAFIHAVVGLALLRQSQTVDPEDGASVYKFYMSVWKAFYFEYAIIPVTAL